MMRLISFQSPTQPRLVHRPSTLILGNLLTLLLDQSVLLFIPLPLLIPQSLFRSKSRLLHHRQHRLPRPTLLCLPPILLSTHPKRFSSLLSLPLFHLPPLRLQWQSSSLQCLSKRNPRQPMVNSLHHPSQKLSIPRHQRRLPLCLQISQLRLHHQHHQQQQSQSPNQLSRGSPRVP